MKLTIHRGTREIGGSCVELKESSSRILIDLGSPMVDPKDPAKKLEVDLARTSPARLREMGVLPAVHGVWADLDDGPSVDAILLSHPHQDHHGLLSFIRKDIPVYLSADAMRMLRRSDAFIRPGARIRHAEFLDHRRGKKIGKTPFFVMPYLMDHSAYGALAFLVDAKGQRLFYSGDFRGHGRKARLFDELCDNPPRSVDRMLIEGTTLGSHSHEAVTEEQLEARFMELFKLYSGLKLVSVSGQNIDRLVTIYRACKHAGFKLVLDLYTAAILEGTRRSTIPHPGPDWHDDGTLKVMFTRRYQQILERHPAYKEVLELSEPFRITQEEISRDPGRHVLIFRGTILAECAAIRDWGKPLFIHSQWGEYMKERSFDKVRTELDRRGAAIEQVHTSGHASKSQMRRLVQAIKPRILSPMHTFHAEEARDLWPRFEMLEDGQGYPV